MNSGTDESVIDVQPTTRNRSLQTTNSNFPIDNLRLTNDFTISAWIYFEEGNAINGNDVIAQGDGFSIDFQNGFFNVSVDELGGSIVATNTPIKSGEWAFYSVVREDGFVTLYINGNFERTSRIDDSSVQGVVTEPWTNDAVPNQLFTGLSGIIDDFRIYNSARTQTELQTILSGDTNDSSGFIRYYSFDGSQNILTDDIGNAGDAALPNNMRFSGFLAPFVVPRVANEFSTTQVATDLELPTDLSLIHI